MFSGCQELTRRINAFEQRCYRRLPKIKWTLKISNEKVLQRIKEDGHESTQKQTMSFAGHVLRGSSGDRALRILEGKLDGTTRKTMTDVELWIDDIKH